MPTFPTARWAEIDALFADALDRPPDERTAFLRARCGDDPEVYHAVTELLAADAEAEAALGESATAFVAHLLQEQEAAPDEALPTGTRVGPYRIEGEFGRGGMGVVYCAARADGTFEKDVALKLVKRGMDTDEVLRRFRYERQILAGLEHPGIARLLDAGAADDGRPYLVMEVVEGEPITAYADSHRLGLEARLALFEQVCAAVTYAHRRLVVHRDLKPSNILVTEDESGTPDGQPTVKLLDFGIARLLAADSEEVAPQTRPEWRILTPEYAAPEQLRGEPPTTATDVYALGVVFYELLAGQRPGPDPRPPSAVAPEPLRRDLRGDLDTLALTALQTDSARRYASAEALLDDLRRWQTGLPLRARPASRGYRVRKFVGRHRIGVALSAAAVALLIGFIGVLLAQQRATVRERDRAEAEREKAQEVAGFLEGLFAASDPFAADRLDTLRVPDLLDQGILRIEGLSEQPLVQAQMLSTVGRIYTKLRRFGEAEPILRKALALRETHAGPEAEATAESLYDLASLLYHTHGEDESDALAQRAFAIRTKLYGERDARVADVQLLLGMLREDEGDAEAAEALLRAALGTLESARGEAHPDVAEAWSRLASVLSFKGDYEGAADARLTGIALHRQYRGDDHPLLATALHNLAFLRVMQGAYDEAEALEREAFAILKPVLGTSHPRLNSYRNQLGLILRKQERYAEAEAVLQDVLASQREGFAGDYGHLAATLTSLSTVYREQGRLAEAEAAQREAYELALDHLDLAAQGMYGQRLGSLLSAQQRYTEAEKLLLASIEGLGEDNPHSRRTRQALAELYEAWGRADEAERWRVASASAQH